MPRVHGIFYSLGNSKVKFPILNLGSGTNCPSARWCPFSLANHKQAGRPVCYAVKAERLYPAVLPARDGNTKIIASLSPLDLPSVVGDLAMALSKAADKRDNIVRFNESGDLSEDNILFAEMLVRELKVNGTKVYTYSKAPVRLINRLRKAGAVVLQSERDFIAVPDSATGKATGLKPCPGVCGPCKRCPNGQRSYILEH